MRAITEPLIAMPPRLPISLAASHQNGLLPVLLVSCLAPALAAAK